MSWMVTVLGWFRAEAGLAYWTKRALRPWSEDETGPYPSFTSAISIFSRAAQPQPLGDLQEGGAPASICR